MARRALRCVALGAIPSAALALLSGCTGTLADLQGPRHATVDAKGAPAPGNLLEYPATFQLHNASWGTVLVESARVPISTVIRTQPELPVSVKAGGTLQVTVLSKLPAAGPAATRTIQLETKGQEPLELQVTIQR